MGNTRRSDEEILDAVDYRAENLPHPIDLLSADLISDVSEVPKTTLLSAASSLDDVRSEILIAAISRLDAGPGAATWDAMRAALEETRCDQGLALILNARADELASDPAFPYFLSGFDRLAVEGVANAVSLACSRLVAELLPFVDTVLLAESGGQRIRTHVSRLMVLTAVLSLALQRLTSGGAGVTSSSEVRRRVAVNAGAKLRAETRSGQIDEQAVDPYVPSSTKRRLPEGNLGRAVEAAADLVLTGGVPLRFGLKLEDVLSDTGLSSATFYRRFGSLAGFERLLIERTGCELVRGFRDDFFTDVLSSIADGSMKPDEAIGELQRRAGEEMSRHVQTKRPGTEVLPWMATEIGTQVFAPAFSKIIQERGEFCSFFAAELSLPLAGGMDAVAVAATLHSYSWVGELLTRNAPDRDLTAAFLLERSVLLQQFVFGVS